jgi:hypothetical protein
VKRSKIFTFIRWYVMPGCGYAVRSDPVNKYDPATTVQIRRAAVGAALKYRAQFILSSV